MDFETEIILTATPLEIYTAWLNSKQHSAMTGGKAKIKPETGSKFSTWDNYITGKILELNPERYIKMQWRTTEFKPEQQDSIVEIKLREVSVGKTKISLRHSGLSDTDTQYKQGWIDFYWTPMKAYFKRNI